MIFVLFLNQNVPNRPSSPVDDWRQQFKSFFGMNCCNLQSRVISTEIWFNSFYIFGIWSLILMRLSFNFRESNAIFTDLSLFTVKTTGDKKQSSSTYFIISRCLDFLASLVHVLHPLVDVAVPVWRFV